MSTGFFAFGLLAWFCSEPNIGCCCLAIAWILHGGSPDDDDGGSHSAVGRAMVNPPPTYARPPAAPAPEGAQ